MKSKYFLKSKPCSLDSNKSENFLSPRSKTWTWMTMQWRRITSKSWRRVEFGKSLIVSLFKIFRYRRMAVLNLKTRILLFFFCFEKGMPHFCRFTSNYEDLSNKNYIFFLIYYLYLFSLFLISHKIVIFGAYDVINTSQINFLVRFKFVRLLRFDRGISWPSVIKFQIYRILVHYDVMKKYILRRPGKVLIYIEKRI